MSGYLSARIPDPIDFHTQSQYEIKTEKMVKIDINFCFVNMNTKETMPLT
jgi:hypothetical protein